MLNKMFGVVIGLGIAACGPPQPPNTTPTSPGITPARPAASRLATAESQSTSGKLAPNAETAAAPLTGTRVEFYVVDEACATNLMSVGAVKTMASGTTIDPQGSHVSAFFEGARDVLLGWFVSLKTVGRVLATTPHPLKEGAWTGVCHAATPTNTAADFAMALWRPSFPGAPTNLLQVILQASGKSKLLAIDPAAQRVVWVADRKRWHSVIGLKAVQQNVDDEYTAVSGPPNLLTALADGPKLQVAE